MSELFERDGCCVKTPLGKSVAFSSPSDAKIAASLANYAVTVGEHFAAKSIGKTIVQIAGPFVCAINQATSIIDRTAESDALSSAHRVADADSAVSECASSSTGAAPCESGAARLPQEGACA